MDIEHYNPKKDPKYSGYIYRFLKKERSWLNKTGQLPRIVRFKGGCGWYIGWFQGDGFVDFFGSSILADSRGVKVYYLVKATPEKICKEVAWPTYGRIGKCALSDRSHDWVYVGKNSRKCRHCGKWEHRRIETVKTIERKTVWEAV